MFSAKVDATAMKAMLDALPKRLRRRTISRGLRAGAKIIADAAVSRTPTRTGALKDSIKVRVNRGESRRGNVAMQVISGKKLLGRGKRFRSVFGDQYYGSFVEFGWRPGSRTARRRTGKRVPYSKLIQGYQSWRQWKKSGGVSKVGDARTPVAGVHMIEGAFKATRQQATKIIEKTITREIMVSVGEMLNKANMRMP